MVGEFVIGTVAAIVMAGVTVLAVVGWVLHPGSPLVGDGMIVAAVAVGLTTVVVATAASQAFRLAVFRYAVDGRLVGPYTEDELRSSFRGRGGRGKS